MEIHPRTHRMLKCWDKDFFLLNIFGIHIMKAHEIKDSAF